MACGEGVFGRWVTNPQDKHYPSLTARPQGLRLAALSGPIPVAYGSNSYPPFPLLALLSVFLSGETLAD